MTLVPAFFIPRFFAAGGAPAAELTSGQSWAVVLVLAAAAAAAAGWRFWRDRGLRWAPARPVSTLLLLFVAFDNIPRLLAGNPWSPVLLAALAAWQLFLDAAFGLLWHDRGRGGFWRAWAAEAAFLPGAAWIGLHAFRGISSDSAALAVLIHLGAFAVGIGLLRWTGRRWPTTSAERARWGLVALASLALAHPWLSPYLVGTGDAKLYAETLQDFLAQWHAGIRPPLVSQSEVAPFGAVFPFRFATYHYYFAAAIDALTGGNLTVYAVQHVTIVLSALGGGGAMYLVLRRVCPRHPGVAGLLAVLYVASPAWLGPLYAMTMIFTVMALPFVPLALGGAWHCLGASSKSRAVAHGAALAAAWHAHPPVGCWVSGMTLLGQGVGLCVDRTAWRALGRQALAWGVCALLCCGLWYSAAEVQPPGAVREEMSTMLASIVKSSFPGSILPAQQPPAGLRDLQLGYSLAAVLVLAAVAAGFGLRRTFIWLLPAVCLLVLTLPVPWLTLHFWQLVPRTIQGITGVWVVQRLLPVLAGTVALALFAVPFVHGAWR